VFVTANGKEARVCGDCTSRQGNPLREAYRYLEEIGDGSSEQK
jgi:hypothetical protein